jgi:hypothetical protein
VTSRAPEVLDDAHEPVLARHHVVVGEGNDVAGRQFQPAVEGEALALAGFLRVPDGPAVAGRGLADHLARTIRRVVVDDDELDAALAGPRGGVERVEGLPQQRDAVVGADEDRGAVDGGHRAHPAAATAREGTGVARSTASGSSMSS